MTNPLEEAVPQQQQGQEHVPVMFLHGVGGLMLYLELLKHVIGLGHPIIVIEYKHVGMRIRCVLGAGVVRAPRGGGVHKRMCIRISCVTAMKECMEMGVDEGGWVV
jgi:hypothetical protein